MKKIIVTLCFIATLLSCQNAVIEKPEKQIDEDVMVDILYDLSLLESIKSQNVSDSDNTINISKYIYKKYKIDSIQFVQNNKFYASDVKNYKKMFGKVKERLDNESNKLDTLMKKKGEKIIPKFNTNTLNSEEPQVK
jgi:Domain of unknown function (DUF4296)